MAVEGKIFQPAGSRGLPRFLVAGIPACRRAGASCLAESCVRRIRALGISTVVWLSAQGRAAGCRPLRQAGMPDATMKEPPRRNFRQSVGWKGCFTSVRESMQLLREPGKFVRSPRKSILRLGNLSACQDKVTRLADRFPKAR